MSKPTVVDACALFSCYQDFLLEEETSFSAFLNYVFDRGHISIDDEGRAIQEYDDTAKPGAVQEGLKTWIAEQARNGRVVEYPMVRTEEKKLRLLGLPNKDHKWISIAIGSEASIIVTADIDLFDPKEKKSNSARRLKVMRDRSGAVARHCRKKLRIHVTTCEGFVEVTAIVDK